MTRKRLSLRMLILKTLLIPVGFILSVIGILLPWRARHIYLNILVGPVCGAVLNSDAFVNFFMNVGFAEERSKQGL